MGREHVLADAGRDRYASQRGAGLEVNSRQELDHTHGVGLCVSLVRWLDGQAVTLRQPGLDEAAEHCVLITFDDDELPDLTSLQCVTGYMGAPWARSEWQVNLDRRRPNRADRADVSLPVEW